MSWNRLANATVLSEEIENRLKQMLRIDLEHLKVKVAEPITREHYIKKEVWIAFSDSVKGSEFVWLINSSKIKRVTNGLLLMGSRCLSSLIRQAR